MNQKTYNVDITFTTEGGLEPYQVESMLMRIFKDYVDEIAITKVEKVEA
jgi:hypothetical protein